MESEFYVPKNSILIGKRIEDIQEEYGVIIDHIHNPTLLTKGRKEVNIDMKVYDYLVLKAVGEHKNIKKLRLDSAKFR